MKRIHTPQVNARYWTAILLASVFGTNLGDFYAHESGLGIYKGIAVLALLAAIVFVIERFDHLRHEVYYWLLIIFIRTGATNIADYLAFRVRIQPLVLTLSLVALLCLFGGATSLGSADRLKSDHALPKTGIAYWLAMLTAGVFGTVVGDICSHAIGEGTASIVLFAIFLGVLFLGRGRAARILSLYWITVAVARTAGTAMGDWFAENPYLHIGLTVSTIVTGLVFCGVLLFWRSRSVSHPASA